MDRFWECVRPILASMRHELSTTHYDFHADITDETVEKLRAEIYNLGYRLIPAELKVLGHTALSDIIKAHTRGMENEPRRLCLTEAEEAIAKAERDYCLEQLKGKG